MRSRFMGSGFALSLLALTLLPGAWAKEGADQYPYGAENWFAGAVPPAGNYYINYFGVYTGSLRDGSGNKVLLGGSTPSVDATFNAFRFLHMTHLRLFGADYGGHIIVPLVHQAIDMGGSAAKTSVGDTVVDPFVFAWHRPSWHSVAALDVILPTGFYNPNDPRVSVGAHYSTFEPLYAASYMPKSGWEASGKFMVDLNTTNPATNYHSGHEFHADYGAGKHFGPQSSPWMAGASGYVLEQFTDDTLRGVSVPAAPGVYSAGRRGQVFAIGPSLGYVNARHLIFMADWQHETSVRNRFGGDKVWFRIVVPVDGFFHGPGAR